MIVLATNNKHKVAEISDCLQGVSCQAIDPDWRIEESGDTLISNALAKAVSGRNFCAGRQAVLAEDTGLFVPALGGRPGVYSARFAGPGVSFDQNIAKLLKEMAGKPNGERRAIFRTVAVLAAPEGNFWISCGELAGEIL